MPTVNFEAVEFVDIYNGMEITFQTSETAKGFMVCYLFNETKKYYWENPPNGATTFVWRVLNIFRFIENFKITSVNFMTEGCGYEGEDWDGYQGCYQKCPQDYSFILLPLEEPPPPLVKTNYPIPEDGAIDVDPVAVGAVVPEYYGEGKDDITTLGWAVAGLFQNQGMADLCEQRIYFLIDGIWVYQGTVPTLYNDWMEWPVDDLNLQYGHSYQWRVDIVVIETGEIFTGDTWIFTIGKPSPLRWYSGTYGYIYSDKIETLAGHKLRIALNGIVYGVPLVDIGDPFAEYIRVYDGNSIKALEWTW